MAGGSIRRLNMKNRLLGGLLLLVLCLTVALGLSGCGPKEPAANPGAYEVTDATGYRVSLPKKPSRIISFNVSTDEIIAELVGPQRIAAFSRLADNRGICCIDPAVVAQVKLRVDVNSTEAIMATRPDLILMADWRAKNVVDSLRGLGLTVYVYKTPGTIKEMEAVIIELGKITAEEERATAMVASMEKRLATVRARVGNIPQEKKLRVAAISGMGAFGGKGSTFADVCSYAGVRNVLAEAGIPKTTTISKEKLVSLNPEALVVPTWNFNENNNIEEFYASVLEDPALQTITGVREKRLIKLEDTYLYATSQYSVEAVERLAKGAYPERF